MPNNDNEEEFEPLPVKITRKYVVPSVFFLFISMIAYYFWVKSNFCPSPSSTSTSTGSPMGDCGLFGDMFGAYSAFFGGLGFLAVAITTIIQMQQAHRTQVETTFFNMLNRLTQIMDNSFFPGTEDHGQEYFKKAMEALKGTYNAAILEVLLDLGRKELPPDASNEDQKHFLLNTKLPDEKLKELMIDAYEKFYSVHEHNLGHYFRYLYNIIKYIRSSFRDKPKIVEEFVGLIQAQMSNDELGLLFYNAISVHGQNLKGQHLFKEWLDSYDFFENIDPTRIFNDAFLDFYPNTHFKFKIRDELKKANR